MNAVPAHVLDQFNAIHRAREAGGAYLASNTMGIIPTSAAEAERACVQQQQDHGIAVWDGGGPWLATLDRYGAVIGRMVGAEARQVCPVTNITDGLWRVFSCFDYRGARRGILTTDLSFTTQEYASHGFSRYGAEVILVPSDPAHHFVPTERMVASILRHQPLVVNLSHAAFESAYVHDLAPIAQACREVGAVFCLDAAQTGFVLPFTLAETGADVLLLQQHKWGCAGTGAACLVATPDFISRHEPALVGWMSHAETFQFQRGPARFGASAWRFTGGTPDVPAKARGARAAEILVDEVGLDRIREINQALVAQLLEGLEGIPHIEAIPQVRRTGFVAVQCESVAEAGRIEHALRARHVILDGRGARLRIGPHFYNDAGDIERLLAALRAVV